MPAADLVTVKALTISVVVPTYRRPVALADAVGSLIDQDYPPERYEIIVVDDAADPATEVVLESFRHNLTAIRLVHSLGSGVAAARNAGARQAHGELLLFCDDDVVLDHRHLAGLEADVREHPNALISGWWEFTPVIRAELQSTPFGRFRLALEHRFLVETVIADHEEQLVPMRLLAANNLGMATPVFRALDGFDESFPGAGAEDQDLSIRAVEAGHPLLLDRRLCCWHNDNRLTLAEYCAREERNAQTMPVMFRRRPDLYARTRYVRENRPIQDEDPTTLRLKKAMKLVLSRRPVLWLLHRLVAGSARLALPDAALAPLYRGLLGLHLFRGFRRAW